MITSSPCWSMIVSTDGFPLRFRGGRDDRFRTHACQSLGEFVRTMMAAGQRYRVPETGRNDDHRRVGPLVTEQRRDLAHDDAGRHHRHDALAGLERVLERIVTVVDQVRSQELRYPGSVLSRRRIR